MAICQRTLPTFRVGRINSGSVRDPTKAKIGFKLINAAKEVPKIKTLVKALTTVDWKTDWIPSTSLVRRVRISPSP